MVQYTCGLALTGFGLAMPSLALMPLIFSVRSLAAAVVALVFFTVPVFDGVFINSVTGALLTSALLRHHVGIKSSRQISHSLTLTSSQQLLRHSCLAIHIQSPTAASPDPPTHLLLVHGAASGDQRQSDPRMQSFESV